MKTRMVLGVSRSTVALIAACGMLGVDAQPAPVAPGVTKVTVTGTKPCKIKAPAAVSVKGKQSPVLEWELADPKTYEFAPSDGIVFDKKQYVPPAGEFTPLPMANGRFRMKDRNHQSGRFDYTINVKVRNSSQTCKKDPTVYNDGSCPEAGC